MNKSRAPKITKLDLLESLPQDCWFSANLTGLIVSVASFYQHMRAMPEEFVEHEKVGSRTMYRIKSSTYNLLINAVEPDGWPPREQEIERHILSIEDVFHNLVCFA
jgi:hypothetical protein